MGVAAGFDHLSLAEDSRQAVLGGESENQIAPVDKTVVRREKKTAVWLAGNHLDSALDLLCVPDPVRVRSIPPAFCSLRAASRPRVSRPASGGPVVRSRTP
jgi:hypothetical protein